MNLAKFYDHIRPHVNLTTANVSGFDKVLNYALRRGTPLNFLAYVLATAFWETAQTMQPVKEAYWKNEAWRKANLRYYPWYGRGLIQTTWERNYVAIAVAMGLPSDTFTKNPDLLLIMEYAIPALFVGMEKGIYTGKDLDDYIDGIDESDEEDLREYKNARRIVNGTDKAETIGKLSLLFEAALKAAMYIPSLNTKVGRPVPPKELITEEKPQTLWQWIKELFSWT